MANCHNEYCHKYSNAISQLVCSVKFTSPCANECFALNYSAPADITCLLRLQEYHSEQETQSEFCRKCRKFTAVSQADYGSILEG
jgi:hypothetical protein